jgi:molybdenum cofactor cytidylyltransferase
VGLQEARRFNADVVMILPADMPFVRSPTMVSVASACARAGAPIVAAHRGRRGHPLALPATLLPALVNASATGSLRDALTSVDVTVTTVEVDDAGVLRDVDVPADLT